MKLEDFLVLLSFVLSFISIFLFIDSIFANEQLNIEIHGLKSITQEEFLYLLDLKEKEKIDEDKITEGIKRIFLKDIFENIVIEKDNNTIRIEVSEKPIVKSINFTGNQYVNDKYLKQFITFKIKDRLKNAELKRSANNIEAALRKKGLVENKVTFKTECNTENCDITFIINEGKPLIIKSIHWKGDIDENVHNFLDVALGDPFDQTVIEEFIKKTKKYFEKQGIIGSNITYSFRNGELLIDLTRGTAIEIELLGVDVLSKKDLLNIIQAYLKENINDNIIKDIINSLISFYRINGFIDVKVYPLLEKQGNTMKVVFIINEGRRKIIEETEVIFSNNTQLEKKEIMQLIINSTNSPFNPDELENDKKRIEDYLKTKGYYYAKIYQTEVKEENEKIKVIFRINEGAQIKIKNLNMEVANNVLKDKVIEILKEFQNIIFYDAVFLEIRRKIYDIYQREGYADVIVDGYYEVKNNDADIFIHINPGDKKYFGKSIILGNRKTKTKFIYERLIQKENQPYNPYVIENERLALYKTGLFSRVDITTQKEKDYIDVIYNFEESPAGAFEFGFGYGEYEKAKGFIELSYINLFGMNKQIFSRIELSKIEKRSSLVYVDPWLWKDLIFKTSLSFENIEVKNIDTKNILYKLKRLGTSIGFEKKFLENFRAELTYEATYSKTWDVLPEIVISDQDIGKIFISGVKASLIYDNRDNPFDPKRGWLAGISSKLSSEFLGSELNFLKTSFYFNKYTEILKGLVLAISIRAGWAWLYGSTNDLPISERYFLGGRDSVRGYAQNTLGPKNNEQPTGGNAFIMGNLELRTSLGKNFFIVNFLDAGNLWKRVGDVDPSNLKYTTGIGLRYKTPVGPLRVDYGYKLNRERNESRGEIHFSIGHAF